MFESADRARMSADELRLTHDEEWALCLGAALGPFKVDDELARSLGLSDRAALDDVVGIEDRADAGVPLDRDEWLLVVRTIERLMSPDDTEWQTVTGLELDETATLLASVRSKVEAGLPL